MVMLTDVFPSGSARAGPVAAEVQLVTIGKLYFSLKIGKHTLGDKMQFPQCTGNELCMIAVFAQTAEVILDLRLLNYRLIS